MLAGRGRLPAGLIGYGLTQRHLLRNTHSVGMMQQSTFFRPLYILLSLEHVLMPLLNVYSNADQVQKCIFFFISVPVIHCGHHVHTQKNVKTLQRQSRSKL